MKPKVKEWFFYSNYCSRCGLNILRELISFDRVKFDYLLNLVQNLTYLFFQQISLIVD